MVHITISAATAILFALGKISTASIIEKYYIGFGDAAPQDVTTTILPEAQFIYNNFKNEFGQHCTPSLFVFLN